MSFIINSPCTLVGESTGLFTGLFKKKHISAQLEGAIPVDHQRSRPLYEWEVMLGIAAVVEAIDQRQFATHPSNSTTPFSGGFCLAISQEVTTARVEFIGGSADPEATASRPRRCWLLPLTFSELETHSYRLSLDGHEPINGYETAGRAHTFLAEVQTEANSPVVADLRMRDSHIYFLDSSSRRTRDPVVQKYLHGAIGNAAIGLNWIAQRNSKNGEQPKTAIDLVTRPTPASVARQPSGRWMCGHNTIINAWIIAMGLVPSKVLPATFNEAFHAEFWTILAAIAGLLDWKTLATFFFCHRLTTTIQTLDAISETRRFEAAQYQDAVPQTHPDGEGGLVARLHQIYNTQESRLAAVSVSEVPYDHSSNMPNMRAGPAQAPRA